MATWPCFPLSNPPACFLPLIYTPLFTRSPSCVGLSRLCSATFEQLLAFGATFCGFSNLEQVLPFRAIFEQNIGLEHISSTKKSTISWKTSIHANFLKAAASLEELRNFPFANDDATIANLAQKLPLYLAASDGVTVTCEDDKLTWWANHKDTLPHWSSLVKKLLLIQLSSASAERVFSLLTNAFGSQQESALQDYLEASVMLRYNNAKRV